MNGFWVNAGVGRTIKFTSTPCGANTSRLSRDTVSQRMARLLKFDVETLVCMLLRVGRLHFSA
jgi:hypothetical protein